MTLLQGQNGYVSCALWKVQCFDAKSITKDVAAILDSLSLKLDF
jgi:hypothetical protein